VKTMGSARAGTLWTLTLSMPFALAAVVLFGDAREAFAHPGALPGALPGVLAAGIGEVLYVWTLGQALDKGDLGLTYAMARGTAMVLVWPFAWAAFGVVPGLSALLGTALVLAGILLSTPKRQSDSRVHLGYTIASGGSVGVYHTGYKAAVRAGATPAVSFLGALLVAVPLLWLLLGRSLAPDLRALGRRVPLRLLLGGGGAAASFLLAVYALSRADSGFVLGLRNSSVGFTVLIALLLGERPKGRQWLGLVAFGASVLAFAYA
jgi:drug/metabolite transporter (DMT)-like permease